MSQEHIQASLREFKMRLTRDYEKNAEVILFGSTARGDYSVASDIDVLVLLPFEPDTAAEERIFDLAYDVELQFGVIFGILVYSKSFWNSGLARVMPIHKNIEREGVGV